MSLVPMPDVPGFPTTTSLAVPLTAPSATVRSGAPAATSPAALLTCDQLHEKFAGRNRPIDNQCYPPTWRNVTSQVQANQMLTDIAKCSCPWYTAAKEDLKRYYLCPSFDSREQNHWTSTIVAGLVDACTNERWGRAAYYQTDYVSNDGKEEFIYRSDNYDGSVSCKNYKDELEETWVAKCLLDTIDAVTMPSKWTQTFANGFLLQAMQCACPHVAAIKTDIFAAQAQCPAGVSEGEQITVAMYDKVIAACAAGDYKTAAAQGLISFNDKASGKRFVYESASPASRKSAASVLTAISLATAVYLTYIL
ncbi:hypothetical protein HDU86_001965 [Geranomyces michiganensis]|nr:hypothetical protein HDU86_001965 [Geranomyces michiganensis]